MYGFISSVELYICWLKYRVGQKTAHQTHGHNSVNS